MKCIDCGCSIDWDNSYGHSRHTCVCYNCLVARAKSNHPLQMLKACDDLIEWGREQEKNEKRNT